MTRVILVRHAAPVVDAALPPGEWSLSADGRVAAQQLRGRLPAGAAVVSSPEVKAVTTLALALDIAPATIRVDPRLAEVHRPGEPVDDRFRERRQSWVMGTLDQRHAGWEAPATVAARFAAALRDCVDTTGADDIVVGTHGMIATAWLVASGHLTPGAPAGHFWRNLQLPDLIEVPMTKTTVGPR